MCRVFETQEPSSTVFNADTLNGITKTLDRLSETVSTELKRQGFASEKIRLDRVLNMRFDGTDTALLVLSEDDSKFEDKFKKAYKEQFGFVLNASVVVDDIKVSFPKQTTLKIPMRTCFRL
jgi:5-oxoprolinase (ATP-hydrolysing)